MIRSRRHKGLKRLHEDDDARGVMAEHAVKLRDILARLNAARTVADMDMPGFRLHILKGELRGFYAVTVRANWRVLFSFAEYDAFDVDLVDYHSKRSLIYAYEKPTPSRRLRIASMH